ncbi:hypothetical protein QAS_4049 [Clostridioides difficile CD9]|uniref:cellulase family glycosylhydrolase n=1 Tax=Clostridioides difficile TaxID=1496 RepID=UPI00038C78B3|nr:cellulase family glycosylhydrolase [Clostridioides difficile]EQE01063.1 hypothetical protein QAS_4049 [Clostridioides difficile CD9]
MKIDLDTTRPLVDKLGVFVYPYTWDHVYNHYQLIDMQVRLAKELGFKYARFPFLFMGEWISGENLQWDLPDYMLKRLLNNGITPICPWEIDGPAGTDYLTPVMDQTKKIMENVVKHYSGRGLIWESQNEPYYLMKASGELNQHWANLVKKYDPDAVYVTGDIGPVVNYNSTDKIWQTAIDNGFLKNADAWSLHPYVDPKSPEDLAKQTNTEFLQAMKQNNLPLITTEFGYSTAPVNGYDGVSEVDQANLATRQLFVLDYLGQPIISLYQLHGTNSGVGGYGMYTGDFQHITERPLVQAYRNIIKELNGYRLIKRIDTGQDAEWVLQYQNRKKVKYVYWNRYNTSRVTVNGQGLTITTQPQISSEINIQPIDVKFTKLTVENFGKQFNKNIDQFNLAVKTLVSDWNTRRILNTNINYSAVDGILSSNLDRDFRLEFLASTKEMQDYINYVLDILNQQKLYVSPWYPWDTISLKGWDGLTFETGIQAANDNFEKVSAALNKLSEL